MSLPTVSESPKVHSVSSEPESIVQLTDVSVRYRVPRERIGTFKEYLIRWVQRKVEYNIFWALKGLTLDIKRGEVFGLVGANGAGKSTLLKVVARILRPTLGRVVVRGKVAPLLELGAGFHPELTGRENIFLYGSLLGFDHRQMEEKFSQIVDFSELHQFIDAPIRTYSSGMSARLGFSVATAHDPGILIVDEILSVGDEAFQQKSSAKIREFRDKGATILLVSHNTTSIKNMCERAAWIDHGILQGIGTPEEIIDNYRENRTGTLK
jgi:ABC-type polysaccharide/polyol phosphate transport system ATPase subunit